MMLSRACYWHTPSVRDDSTKAREIPRVAVLSVSVLLVTSFFTRFFWIGRPADVVWDEQHFARYAQAYFQGRYFFDVQPPLGHLILFSALKMAHAHPGDFDFVAGLPYPANYPYIAARFIPALAGALLPLIIFFVARALLFSNAASFFAGMLVVLDNAILSESHFALIDIFVPFFGFSALLAFLWHRKRERFSVSWWWTLLATAFLAGLAVSVKWTGAGSLAVMGIAGLMDLARRKGLAAFVTEAAVLCTIAAAVYVSVFAVHFKLLPRGGIGNAFMSPEFRSTLAGTPESMRTEIHHPGFWRKFEELNEKILAYNANRTIISSDSSRFYLWPTGRKQIYFWVDRADSRNRIAMRANPVVWFFALDGMVAGVLFGIIRRKGIGRLLRESEAWREKFFSLAFLFAIYLVNWLPFLAIKRDMYLYHYFTALIASLLIATFFAFELLPAIGLSREPQGQPMVSEWLYGGVLLLAACGFIVNSPLSYGFRPFLGR